MPLIAMMTVTVMAATAMADIELGPNGSDFDSSGLSGTGVFGISNFSGPGIGDLDHSITLGGNTFDIGDNDLGDGSFSIGPGISGGQLDGGTLTFD